MLNIFIQNLKRSSELKQAPRQRHGSPLWSSIRGSGCWGHPGQGLFGFGGMIDPGSWDQPLQFAGENWRNCWGMFRGSLEYWEEWVGTFISTIDIIYHIQICRYYKCVSVFVCSHQALPSWVEHRRRWSIMTPHQPMCYAQKVVWTATPKERPAWWIRPEPETSLKLFCHDPGRNR